MQAIDIDDVIKGGANIINTITLLKSASNSAWICRLYNISTAIDKVLAVNKNILDWLCLRDLLAGLLVDWSLKLRPLRQSEEAWLSQSCGELRHEISREWGFEWLDYGRWSYQQL